MKKYAFTLAETLMTMAIIGVCAALMITSIKNVNPTGQADAIMAKKAVTTFADSTRQIMVHYAKNFKMNDVYSDKEKTQPCKNATCLFNIYGKFVQITKQLSADEAGNFDTTPPLAVYQLQKLTIFMLHLQTILTVLQPQSLS